MCYVGYFWNVLEKLYRRDWGRRVKHRLRNWTPQLRKKKLTQDYFVSIICVWTYVHIACGLLDSSIDINSGWFQKWVRSSHSFLKRSASLPANTVWSFKFISFYFDFLIESIYLIILIKIISMERKHEDRNPSRESVCMGE